LKDQSLMASHAWTNYSGQQSDDQSIESEWVHESFAHRSIIGTNLHLASHAVSVSFGF